MSDAASATAAPKPNFLDRCAAYVLARMLAEPDVRTRRLALGRIDPLARGAVAKRVVSLLDDAEFLAPASGEPHRIRLALLDAHGIEVAANADASEVEALAAKLPPNDRVPRWRSTLAMLAAIAAVGVAIGVYVLLRPEPYAALADASTESPAAFRDGGRPLHREAIDATLGDLLAGLSIAWNHHIERGTPYDPELRRIAAAVRAPELVRALGSYPADATQKLVDAYARLVRGEGDADGLATAIARVNRVYAEHGLGYRVEAFPIRMQVIALAIYSVERVALHGSGASRRTVLTVARLDRLNLDVPYLGYIGPDGAIVVPSDAADRFATTVLLPLLEPRPRLTLMDPQVEVSRVPWIVPTHAAAAASVKQAFTDAGCDAELGEVVSLLAERRALFEQWSALLAQNGARIAFPESYRYDLDGLDEAASDRLPRFGELRRLHDALGETGPSRSFACARDAVVDALALPFLAAEPDVAHPDEPRAPSLVAVLDPGQTMDVAAFRALPAHYAIRRDLASLQRARSIGLPLTLMLRCYTHGGSCDRASEVATVFTFMELARELRLASFVEPDRAGASAVGAVFRELAARPSAEVARASAAVFRRVFGRQPPPVAAR